MNSQNTDMNSDEYAKHGSSQNTDMNSIDRGNFNIHVASGYGYETRNPFVSLKVQDIAVQLTVEQARNIAQWLIEAAEAAEVDGFLFEFTNNILENEARAAAMLFTFRKYREDRINKT